MEFFENLFKRNELQNTNNDVNNESNMSNDESNQEEVNQQNDKQSEDYEYDDNIDFSEEIELKSHMNEEENFNDKYIRNLLKRSDISLADYKVYDKVKNLYMNILSDAVQNVNKITFHRGSNKVTESDMYLLENLNTQNMFGGNYIGYCDSNPGQCSDFISNQQCGGGADQFCDGQPSQCGVGQQSAGFLSFCDGHPSQCGAQMQDGGFMEFRGNKVLNKSRGVMNRDEFGKLVNEKSNYQFSKKALKKLQEFVENEVVDYLNKQKENLNNQQIFNNVK